MIATFDPQGESPEPQDDPVDRALDDLRRRVHQLEADGKAAEGAALIIRELGAKQVLNSPDGDSITVDDGRRQMAAVLLYTEIVGLAPKEAA